MPLVLIEADSVSTGSLNHSDQKQHLMIIRCLHTEDCLQRKEDKLPKSTAETSRKKLMLTIHL